MKTADEMAEFLKDAMAEGKLPEMNIILEGTSRDVPTPCDMEPMRVMNPPTCKVFDKKTGELLLESEMWIEQKIPCPNLGKVLIDVFNSKYPMPRVTEKQREERYEKIIRAMRLNGVPISNGALALSESELAEDMCISTASLRWTCDQYNNLNTGTVDDEIGTVLILYTPCAGDPA